MPRAAPARLAGYRGLYKGLSMNWFKGPVAVSVSFLMNDFAKAYIAGEGQKER